MIIRMSLSEKVKLSIERIKAFEPLDGGGYFLGFSGGKDSCVIKALSDMAGVKYEAHYHITTVDPPELFHFVRDKHPDVIWDRPKYSMRQLIIKTGFPPTKTWRYCCEYLKEVNGVGCVTMTGTRWAESQRRQSSHGVVTMTNNNNNNKFKIAEEVGANYIKNKQSGLIMNEDNDLARRTVELCYRTNKTLVNPIIDWSDEDVWDFIHSENIPYCKLYDEGFCRLGCVGCPLGSLKNRHKGLNRWPHIKRMYIKAFDDMLDAREARGKDRIFNTGEDVMDWWLQDAPRYSPIEDQLKIGEDLE